MKLDRLIGILTVLLQNERTTAPQLAVKFEVTRRTIGRDIDTLCQAGIPIVTYQGARGGISIAEGYKLDKSVLTSDELSGMITALKGIGSVSETAQVERILDKLGIRNEAIVSLQEPVIIDLASHYKGSLTSKIMLIKQAILDKRLIKFDYYYEKGEMSRCIEPYIVVFQWMAWYVFGFCPQRQDFRMFKLTRLWNLELCEERYVSREIPSERKSFNSYFIDDKKFVGLFHSSAKYQLIEAYGLNCFTETEEGKLRFEITYTNEDYIISWILAFGSKVKVVEPPDIAEKIKEIAENIVLNYK